MSEYAGLSLREIYGRKCEQMHCKKNSQFLNTLPTKPDLFEIPTNIDLSKNIVGPKGLMAVMEVVRCCTGLTALDLRDQQMTNESVAAICAVCARHPTLIKLNLSDNPLTITGGAALIELAKNNPVIEEILLENTEVKPSMKNAINAQLARNKKSKGIAADGELIVVDGAAAASLDEEERPTRVLDASVARSTLAGLPSSLDPAIFDENPTEELIKLCRRFDASYSDPQFPSEAISVQRVLTVDYGEMSWKRLSDVPLQRPGDGKMNPRIYPEDDSLMLLPRELRPSFSWLFTCVGATLNPQEIRSLITPATVNPYGVYSVKFSIDGKTRYVVVDDYFPVDINGDLLFAHASHDEYMWPAILEKAVAKLHGGYQALDQSLSVRHPVEKPISSATVMCDLCGGIGISRDLHHEEFNSEDWWNTLIELSSSNNTHLIATSVKDDDTAQAMGIEPSHTYHLLHVRQINGFKLLHLSSRWATGKWNGDWHDRSPLWEQYSSIASALDIRNQDPASFWMPYVKFLQLFSAVHLCRVFPDTQFRMLEGSWTPSTAGGAYFDPSWTTNPRYKLTFTQRSTVFLNLALPDDRFTDSQLDALAFHVFRGSNYPIRYDKDLVTAKTSYVITNSVSFDGVFEEGDYWLVPSTYTASKLGKYLLRIFSTGPFIIRHEDIRSYWDAHEEIFHVESSGEYQNGEDNPQLALKVAASEKPAKIHVRMHTPESEQLSLALFLVHNPRSEGRVLGPIPEENIVAKTKFVISNTVTLEASIPGGNSNYVIVPCINPESTSTSVVFNVWSCQVPVTVEPLPIWHKKSVTCQWDGSGPYQDATKNPQIELVTPIPNQTFVVAMTVSQCSDPSITFFVVGNQGRVGEGMRGKIPDEKVLAKAPYVRHESVMKEFCNGPNPLDSYIIVPSLQPPGSEGRCVITVSSTSETFQLRPVAA